MESDGLRKSRMATMKLSRVAQGALPLLAIKTSASRTTPTSTTSSSERKSVMTAEAPSLRAEGILVSATAVAAAGKEKKDAPRNSI